jgi:hypothetical protein
MFLFLSKIKDLKYKTEEMKCKLGSSVSLCMFLFFICRLRNELDEESVLLQSAKERLGKCLFRSAFLPSVYSWCHCLCSAPSLSFTLVYLLLVLGPWISASSTSLANPPWTVPTWSDALVFLPSTPPYTLTISSL